MNQHTTVTWCHTHHQNTHGSTIMCNGHNWTQNPCQITTYSIRTPHYEPKPPKTWDTNTA